MARSIKFRTFAHMAALALAGFSATQASAAPLKSATSLPLEGSDLEAAKAFYTGDDLQAFATFIKGLDVFPDHENPTTIAEMSDRNKPKKYYVMPYFRVREADGTVGAQETADAALTLLTETQGLTSAFDLPLEQYARLNEDLDDRRDQRENFFELLEDATDPDEISSIQDIIASLDEAIANLEAELTELNATASDALGDVSSRLQESVVNQVRLKLALLGVTSTAAEDADLESHDPTLMVDALASMFARASQLGQYGVRQIVYRSGYSDRERDFIAKYRLIRGDTTVSSLRASTVFARPTSVTALDSAVTREGVAASNRLFLGVNAGSRGRCGNTATCNVTVDFTYTGALMAATSKSGAVVIPVTFEADVSFTQPPFRGTVSCDFQTGWQAQGRADVKDGAVIYDGDVYNRIHYEAFENGGCDMHTEGGSTSDPNGAYYIIKHIYENYMQLKMRRGARARAEKDAYQDFVNDELQRHAQQSQQTSFDFWSLSTWIVPLGPIWGTFTSFVIGAGRSFYWHTRIEDQKTTDRVKFETTISQTGLQSTERFTFDGNPLVCWRGTGFSKFIGACPTEQEDEYAAEADHDVGANADLCGDEGTSPECLEEAEEAAEDETTDDNGVTDPWG